MSRRPILFAHRGAAAEQPENTLPSFRRALELGADALETDLHMTADGELVVAHDATGERTAGVTAEIRRTTRAELARWDAGWGFRDDGGERPFAGRGYRIPTLEEVLTELPEVPINVDVKQRRPSIVAPLLRLVRRLGAEDRVRIASFHTAPLARVRASGYRGETSLSRAEVMLLLAVPAAVFRRVPGTGRAAQLPDRAAGHDLGRRMVIDKCHRAGLRVDYWTINDADRAGELLALGADGIMTDDPAAIRPAFDRLRSR